MFRSQPSKISVQFAAMLFVMTLLAGCNSSTDDRLVGKWSMVKPDSLSRKVAGDSQQTPEPSTMPSKMEIEFTSSGKLTTTTQIGKIDSEKTGTWRALANAPDSNPIRIECQIGLQTTEHEIELEQDSIQWIPPNMAGTKQKLRFKRQ